MGDELADHLAPINVIAKESGVASSALRYYERCGLITLGVKIRGKRHYPHSVVHRLSVIKVCQAVGFSLTEIANMLDMSEQPHGAWRDLAQRRKHDIERQIRLLRSLADTLDAAMDCNCIELAECPEMGPQGELASRAFSGGQEFPERWFARSRVEVADGVGGLETS